MSWKPDLNACPWPSCFGFLIITRRSWDRVILKIYFCPTASVPSLPAPASLALTGDWRQRVGAPQGTRQGRPCCGRGCSAPARPPMESEPKHSWAECPLGQVTLRQVSATTY